MNDVENRIVQMEFDNEQFEQAVATTMSTLDKFKEKLNFKGAGKGLDDLSKTTGNYNYTLNDIGKSLDQLNGRFSLMGNVGRRVLENLTDSAYNFATKGIRNMFSDVTSGGLSRAMNLEQAKFQLQGILKDAGEVKRVIYDDILPELQGTPYSLDQAAVVIGQLGASGITTSKQVREATRAIAGLAAMSGHGFDEVGRIFSKVAGQGNMMGGELQQLSAYGINAAANISEYFQSVVNGNTKASKEVKQHIADIIDAYGSLDEGTIRDAASKRMIFYEDMAAAMDTLYGEHAKKSTEMYTGALEDLKAALARIGAEPAAVGLEFLRDAFNALVPAVDAVNSVLKPFTNATKDIVKNAEGENAFGGQMYGTLAKKVQDLGHQFANLFVQMDENGKITRWTAESIDEYKKSLDDMEASGKKVLDWQKRYAAYASEGDAIMNPGMWRILTASTESFTNIVTALGKALNAIGKGFKAAMPRVTLNMIAKVVEKFRDFTNQLILGRKGLERLKSISQAVFTPLGLAVRVVAEVFKTLVIVGKAVYKALKPALNTVFAFLSATSQTITGLSEMSISFSKTAAGAIIKFGVALAGLLVKTLHLDKLFGLLTIAFNKLASGLDFIGKKIRIFFSDFEGNSKNIIKMVSEFLHLDKVIAILSNGFNNLWTSIKQIFHFEELTEVFKKPLDVLKKFLKETNFSDFSDNIRNFIDWFKNLRVVDRFVNTVSDALDRLRNSASKLTAGPASKLRSWLLKIGAGFAEMFQQYKDGQLFVELIRRLSPTFNKFKDTMSEFTKKVKPFLETFKEIVLSKMGFETFGEAATALFGKIKSLLSSLKELLGFVANFGSTNATKAMDKVSKSFNKFIDDKLTKRAKAFAEGIKDFSTGFGMAFGIFGKSLKGIFAGIDEQGAKKFINMITLLAMSVVYFKKMRELTNTIKAWGSVGKNLAAFTGSLADGFGIKKINIALANTIRLVGLAFSLLLLGTALRQLGSLDWKQIAAGTVVMGIALGAFIAIFNHFNKLAADGKIGKDNTMQVLQLAGSLIAISAGVLILAEAMKRIGSLSVSDLAKGLVSIGLVLFSFVKLFQLLSGMDIKGQGIEKFNKAAFSFIGLAQGIKMLADCIEKIGVIDTTTLLKGVLAILALMAGFALFTSQVKENAKVFSAAIGMIAIAGAIMIMAKAIGMIQAAIAKENFGYALLTIVGFIALFAEFASIAGSAEHSILAASAGILMFASSLFIIAGALALLSLLAKSDTFGAAVVALGIIFAGMAAFAHFSNESTGKAGVGMLALAAGVLVFTGALLALANVPFGQLIYGIGMMGIVLVSVAAGMFILSGAIKLLDKSSSLNLLVFASGLLMLASALYIVSNIPILGLCIALGALAVSLLVLGGVLTLLSHLSVGIILVAGAFALLGVACIMVGGGIMLFVMALTALIPLIMTLAAVDTGTLSKGLEVLKLAATGLAEDLGILAVGLLKFGGACIVAGIGVGIVAVGFGLLAAAGLLCSVSILSLAGAIATFVTVIRELFGHGLLSGITEGFSKFGTGIKTSFKSLFTGLKEEASGEDTKEIGSKPIENAAQGASEAADANKPIVDAAYDKLLSGGKPSLDEMKEYMLQSSTDGATGYADNFGNSAGEVKAGLHKMMSGMDGEFKAGEKKATNSSTKTSSNYGAHIGSAKGAVSKAAGSLVNAGTTQFAKGSSKSGKEGTKSGEAYGSGIGKAKGTVKKSASSLDSAGRAALAQHQKSWGNVGEDAGSGFAQGIRRKIADVASAAASMVRRAISAAKAAQDSNSPSKEFDKLGVWADEGYIGGMKRLSSKVSAASSDMVSGGLNSAMNAIMQISDAMATDPDFTPTITPVVDLTNVDQSMNAISNKFGQTFGLNSPYASMNAAFAAASFNAANQNDKFKSIDRLSKKIDSMTETMNSRSLNVYNNIEGSTDPDAFAEGLVRSFRLNARTV